MGHWRYLVPLRCSRTGLAGCPRNPILPPPMAQPQAFILLAATLKFPCALWAGFRTTEIPHALPKTECWAKSESGPKAWLNIRTTARAGAWIFSRSRFRPSTVRSPLRHQSISRSPRNRRGFQQSTPWTLAQYSLGSRAKSKLFCETAAEAFWKAGWKSLTRGRSLTMPSIA